MKFRGNQANLKKTTNKQTPKHSTDNSIPKKKLKPYHIRIKQDPWSWRMAVNKGKQTRVTVKSFGKISTGEVKIKNLWHMMS